MEQTQVKVGRKTSEFWLTMAAQVLAALAVVLGQVSESIGVQVASIVAGAATSIFSIFGYQALRAKVKATLDSVELVKNMIGRAR